MEETATQFGSYRLLALLGRGSSGEVWRAEGPDGDVAVKLIRPDLSADPMFRRRFHHELRIASGIDDVNVVSVRHFGELDGRCYIVSDLVTGENLEAHLAGGALPPLRAVEVIEQVARALDAAHARGLIHRGVKPSNILIDANGVAYLGDFGVAPHADEASPYLAPERLKGAPGDDRSDVYSLACVLSECLTGATPFPADADGNAGPPPRPSEDDPAVPRAFDVVLAAGMAADPAARYASAGALGAAARAALTSDPDSVAPAPPDSAAPAGASSRARRGILGWSRRKLMVAGLACIGIVAMTGVTFASLVMPFLMKADRSAGPPPGVAPPPTTTAGPYIAPLVVRPVDKALVAAPDRCIPGPPPPPAPPREPVTVCDVERKAEYFLGPVGLELTLTSANAVKLPTDQFFAVQLVMDSVSSDRFARYTGTMIGKQVAFVRDGLVLAAPSIATPIDGESLQLSGEFTRETAETIARMLRDGT